MGDVYLARPKTVCGKTHLVVVKTGYETKALCGVKTVRFVTNMQTGDPIEVKDHWLSSPTMCAHCRGRYMNG